MPGSWNDLAQQGHVVKPDPVDNEYDTLCMHVFTSAPGRLLLAAMRKKYFDAPMNQLADERALRVRIANQQFIRELEIATERGIAAASKKKPAA